MERTEKNEPKNESKQAEAKEAKLKPQEAIDHKHSNPSPTDAHIDGWLKDTALRVGKPSAASIQKATIEQLGNQHNLQTKGIKTLDAMTSAIHAKMTRSNPKTSIADTKAIVDKVHKTRTERANADYKAIQDGDKTTIDRVGRSEALKLPGLASDHRSTIKAHLARTFSKSGGDSKSLGLKPGADFTVAELKNAYRSASLKAHPDRGGSVEKFQALKESYDRMMPKAKSPALDKVAEQTGMTREEVAKAVKRRTAKAPKAAESKAKESGLDFLHSPETAVTAGETVHGTGINEGVRHSLILKQPKEHGGDILNWKASTKIGLPATAVSRINNLPGHSKEWSSYSGKQKAEQLEDSLNHLSVLQGKFDPKLIKDPQLHEKYKAASEHIASSMFDRMSEKEKHDWADSMHDRSQRFGSVTKSPIVQRIQTEMNGRADKIEEKHYADRKAAKKAGAGKKPPEDDLFATKAVKRSKAKAEPIAKKATSEDKPWDRKLTREEIAKKRKENEKLRKTRTDNFFDENSHHSPAF